jgi:transcriptional regulator with XRE-family HTH domain
MITSAQSRAARAFLDWSREQLAAASKVALRTIVDFERNAREPRHATLDVIERAFESAGIIFLTDGGMLEGGPGVRLGKQRAEGVMSNHDDADNDDDGTSERAVTNAVDRLTARIEARGLADEAIDEALTNVEAAAQEKDRRRSKLKEFPPVFKSILGSGNDDK